MHAGSSWIQDIRTVTFDCYGTLIDWSVGLKQSFQAIFGDAFHRHEREWFDAYVEEEAGLEAGAYQSYRTILAQCVERLAARFDLPLSPNQGDDLANSLLGWKPFADTNAALTRLAKRFRLGVLSNIDDDLFRGTARHFAVEFDFVVTATQVQSYKPAPGHFRRMLESEGPGTQVLHVAQSLYHDGAPAQELGLAFAWVNRYKQSNSTGVRPTVETMDLQTLANILCSS